MKNFKYDIICGNAIFSNCAGLLYNQIVWNVAIASIGAFALSGIICYISDLAKVKENKL